MSVRPHTPELVPAAIMPWPSLVVKAINRGLVCVLQAIVLGLLCRHAACLCLTISCAPHRTLWQAESVTAAALYEWNTLVVDMHRLCKDV